MANFGICGFGIVLAYARCDWSVCSTLDHRLKVTSSLVVRNEADCVQLDTV
jgi:hypothetical protein